ncbi:MAG: hypothetical protein RIS94_2559 [Pseudomonadota bacterium]
MTGAMTGMLALLPKVVGALDWQRIRLVEARRPIVLAYHRVCHPLPGHDAMSVSPDHFAAQVAELAATREVVPLSRLLTTRSDRPLAAITFDDGYRDVVTQGLPVLERHGCPATLFLATGYIGGTREFWWDELPRVFRQGTLPRAVEVRVPGSDSVWRLGPDATTAEREAVLDAVWWLIDALTPLQRADEIARLADLLGCDLGMRPEFALLADQEVAGLHGSLLDIGAHTVNHTRLTGLGATERRQEIRDSQRRCRELTGRNPSAFAYPYGLCDPAAIRDVHDAGFDVGVTISRATVRPGVDPLAVPRIPVGDWDRATFRRRIPAAPLLPSRALPTRQPVGGLAPAA